MPSRHRSRERAVQILYQLDMRKHSPFESIDNFYDSLYSEEAGENPETPPERPERDKFMEDLVTGAASKAGELDALVQKYSQHWKLERMPAVDRNILRLAAYEMLYGGTPAPVAIDEALELARRFSGDESVSFINGVLDALRKEKPAVPPDAHPSPEDEVHSSPEGAVN